MSKKLLDNIRSLNQVVQVKGAEVKVVRLLCEQLGSLLDANVIACDVNGYVCGHAVANDKDNIFGIDKKIEPNCLSHEVAEFLLNVHATKENIDLGSFLYGEVNVQEKPVTALVMTLSLARKKIGTLLVYRQQVSFEEEEIALAEASLLPMALVIESVSEKASEELLRQTDIVKSAMNTLSYSELEAMRHILKELGKDEEGLLVASRVADNVGITRSVIVNALRKCESAGVIESRSLGMKGTFIKVLNPKLAEEFNNLKK